MLDSTKLREHLGWQDRISLDQGLDECIAWVKSNFDRPQAPTLRLPAQAVAFA